MAMLSRVADSLFWMGRYLERAEQMARQFQVTQGILTDLAGPDPEGAKAEWQTTLASLCVPNLSLERLVFDATELSTLAGCIVQARENARQVREVIGTEMWERLNESHWRVIEATGPDEGETAANRLLTEVLMTTATWDGLTDSCMHRGEAWLFLKLGKWIERLERIARVTLARHRQSASSDSTTTQNVVSIVMLKSVGALEAYRKLSPTGVDRQLVLEFLLFHPSFPRSLRFCALEAASHTARLSQLCHESDAAVGRAFGRLASRLENTDIEEAVEGGVEVFLKDVLADNGRASALLQRSYFLH